MQFRRGAAVTVMRVVLMMGVRRAIRSWIVHEVARSTILGGQSREVDTRVPLLGDGSRGLLQRCYP